MSVLESSEPKPSSWKALSEEHQATHALCDDLIARAETGEWKMCDAVWDQFARRLEAHMQLEETELFPRFARTHPEQYFSVARFLEEHRDIRSEISRLGIAIQLHELRESSVRELVDRLERHAKSENRAFYPWCLTAEMPRIAAR